MSIAEFKSQLFHSVGMPLRQMSPSLTASLNDSNIEAIAARIIHAAEQQAAAAGGARN
ncbi:hypothetical protein [Bradyrhizobium sp. USDA 4508]